MSEEEMEEEMRKHEIEEAERTAQFYGWHEGPVRPFLGGDNIGGDNPLGAGSGAAAPENTEGGDDVC